MTSVRREWLVSLALVVFVLTLAGLFALQPLLYTAKTASTSSYHEDLPLTGNLTRTDGALVLPEWATSLNLTGPLVLDIKLGDFESANRTLQQYLRSGQSLSGLVVKLDMSDTDAAAFQRDNQANIQALQQLLNQTGEFDQLQSLQVQYRESGDTAMLKSVQLQGEELRKKVQANYQGYASRQERVVNVSQKYGQNTSAYEQSVLDFAAVVAAIEATQDERATSVPVAIRAIQDRQSGGLPAITFQVVPDHGVYGDRLSMAGTVRGPAGTQVTIFSDGKPLAGVATGDDGGFDFPYRVGEIEAGRHTAYAAAGVALSDEQSFTITKLNSTLALAVNLVEVNGSWRAVCTGNLTAEGDRPVVDAPVQVLLDGKRAAQMTTNGNGSYRATVQNLTGGTHMLKARFDPAGFPLNRSESAPVTVEIPSILGLLALLLYALGIGGAAIGAVLYLRRRRTAATAPHERREEPVVELPPAPTVEEATGAATLLAEGVDGREAITRLYRRLVRELDARNPGCHLRSKTPREIADRFAAAPCGVRLTDLVGVHERIRYAGREPTEEDIRRVREDFIYVITEGRQ
ncbi:DUF4129 domain-containing protein [Methanosphaerula subterraneus]|uniref:DUF4129 domain-containing protein n=1 Tax=Methanosphaerula subterraneus TaxID=3350244 RepID=UPI003F874BC1